MRILLTYIFVLLLLPAAGCTDFVEPNQLAFVMGTAIDYAGDGSIEVNFQIVIPSQMSGPFKGGSSGDSDNFVVLSAVGRDIFEASQKIQKKTSRRLMTNHRIVIAISEEFFNKNDVSKLFDKLGRDPANNLRDVIILVKGSKAKDFLMLKHPMEHLSSIAAGKELLINDMKSFSSREFILDSVSEGTRPLVPVMQIEKIRLSGNKTKQIAVVSGFAVLNKKLKVQDILDNSEGSAAAWMAGKGSADGITIPWKDGSGTLSFRLTHPERRIRSVRGNDPKHLILTVKAQAYLLENKTPLDMYNVEDVVEVQKYMNEQIQKELQQTMDRVRQRGSDVFGFGEYLHRKHPYWWKSQKNDWDETFKETDVMVKADILLRSVGASGSQLK